MALLAVVSVAYLSNQNVELLSQPFQVAGERYVPLYTAFVIVFLLGFLPVVTLLLVHTLRQDLARRRQRRFDRETQSWQASFRRAVDFQADMQYERASEELERVLADQPDDFSALLRYGAVLRNRGRVDDALEVHQRSAVLYPQSAAVILELIEDYESRGEPDVVAQLQDRLLRDFQGNGLVILRRRLSEALARQDWDTASVTQERIDNLHKGGVGDQSQFDTATRHILRYQSAVRLIEEGNRAQARDQLEELSGENPESIPVLMTLADLSMLEGRIDEALRQWRGIFSRTESATVLQRIEDRCIEIGDPMRAIETLQGIISTAKDDLLPRFFLGQLYARLEMHQEALKVLEGIRTRGVDSPALLLLVGELRQRRGDTAAAVDAYRSSMEVLGLTTRRYPCGACGSIHHSWSAICTECGTFGLIELELELDEHRDDETSIGIHRSWPVYDDESKS